MTWMHILSQEYTHIYYANYIYTQYNLHSPIFYIWGCCHKRNSCIYDTYTVYQTKFGSIAHQYISIWYVYVYYQAYGILLMR